MVTRLQDLGYKIKTHVLGKKRWWYLLDIGGTPCAHKLKCWHILCLSISITWYCCAEPSRHQARQSPAEWSTCMHASAAFAKMWRAIAQENHAHGFSNGYLKVFPANGDCDSCWRNFDLGGPSLSLGQAQQPRTWAKATQKQRKACFLIHFRLHGQPIFWPLGRSLAKVYQTSAKPLQTQPRFAGNNFDVAGKRGHWLSWSRQVPRACASGVGGAMPQALPLFHFFGVIICSWNAGLLANEFEGYQGIPLFPLLVINDHYQFWCLQKAHMVTDQSA